MINFYPQLLYALMIGKNYKNKYFEKELKLFSSIKIIANT